MCSGRGFQGCVQAAAWAKLGAGFLTHEAILSEKKREPRVEAAFRVRYKSMDDLVVAYSKNLSRGGLFLRTKKLLPVDSTVRLHLDIPDGGEAISMPCRVAFVRDDTDWGAVGQASGMGIEFLEPNEEVRDRVERFLAECTESDEKPESKPGRKLKVLVVDDDDAYTDVAAERFRARGDEVITAKDGLDALAVCIKEPPDLILCDVNMPRMDGWQFLRMVRSRPTLKGIPFLFLTTLAEESDRLKGYRLGVDDYVTKPYKPSEVEVRADQALLRAKRSRQPEQDSGSLRGDLEQVGLPAVLSFLEMEKKTGVVQIEGEMEARLVVHNGTPLRVDRKDANRESADEVTAQEREYFHKLLDLRHGRFEFMVTDVTTEDHLKSSITALLLEHARLSDEGRR